MPWIIDLWLGDIQYGMQQLQLYSSGQLISMHISLAAPLTKFAMHFSIQHQPHILHQQSDEILFHHFMTMLNTTFESKLALEDEGYESSSENFNIPTPL